MFSFSKKIKDHDSRRSETVMIFDTPEKNPTSDGVDAYAERIRVPLLSRIYSGYACTPAKL